jgi:hypothetical protein
MQAMGSAAGQREGEEGSGSPVAAPERAPALVVGAESVAEPSGAPGPLGAARALALQRTIGNRAVAGLILARDPTPGTSGQAQQTWGTGSQAPVADPAARWATMLSDAGAHRWASVADAVVPLPIELLLDALEQLRDAGLLTAFNVELALMPIDIPQHFRAAMLAITTASTDERLAAQKRQGQLTDDELSAIQERKRSWLKAGTAADARPVRRWDYETFGPYKGGRDAPSDKCVDGSFDPKFANQKPEEWLNAFLDFYDFEPPPIHDRSNTSALFNHRATIVAEVIDLAYEHWLYSTQQLWIPTFKNESDLAAPNTGFFLDRSTIASVIARSYQDKRGPAESKNLTFQIVWPYTYHGNIWNAKSQTDSAAMVQAQVGITWQHHHDDEPGVEYQGFAQLQFGKYKDDPDTRARLQQVMVGAQFAYVIPLLEQAAQVQFFGQLLAGASGLNSTSAGGGAQAAVGVQMAVNVPYTKGIVQLVGAVQGGFTGSAPLHDKGSVTGDVGAQVGLVVKLYKW